MTNSSHKDNRKGINYFDMSDKDKKVLLKKAAKGANEMQRELINSPEVKEKCKCHCHSCTGIHNYTSCTFDIKQQSCSHCSTPREGKLYQGDEKLRCPNAYPEEEMYCCRCIRPQYPREESTKEKWIRLCNEMNDETLKLKKVLLSQKREMVEEIRGMKRKPFKLEAPYSPNNVGIKYYNQALDDILEKC